MEDSEGKAKLRVSASMAELLTALSLRTLSTGADKGFMEEDGERNEYDVQEGVTEMTCSSPRRPLCSHSLVCSENYLFILGIGLIFDKEL